MRCELARRRYWHQEALRPPTNHRKRPKIKSSCTKSPRNEQFSRSISAIDIENHIHSSSKHHRNEFQGNTMETSESPNTPKKTKNPSRMKTKIRLYLRSFSPTSGRYLECQQQHNTELTSLYKSLLRSNAEAPFTQDAQAGLHANPLMLPAMLCEHSNWQQCVPFFASSICEHFCVLCERGLKGLPFPSGHFKRFEVQAPNHCM